MIIACLVCTSRPEWRPFVEHQIAKQVGSEKKLVLVNDRTDQTIPEKRTELIRAALGTEGVRYIAWFDDDDWSSPTRLTLAVSWLDEQPRLDAVGSVSSWFISTETRKAERYHAPEGIIFNSAVFRASSCPDHFSRALTVGEDTDWLERWHRRGASYLIVREPLSAWLCHRNNITNRLDTRCFDQTPPRLLDEKDWALVP